MAKPFDHLVFDLDDTLLDTYHQLIPRASRDACEAMISVGLATDVEHCLDAWEEHGKQHSRREIFLHLVGQFGVLEGRDPSMVARRGFQSFYNRKVEPDITLFRGARELLGRLKSHYGLHLVTSGSRATQEEKIRILDIADLFDNILHVDPSQGARKRDAFRQVMKLTGSPPSRYLSVGNRIDTDIGEARELGWQGCWVRYGEHANMGPANPTETPEFTIVNISELIEKCRL